jgi:hypothetical protein
MWAGQDGRKEGQEAPHGTANNRENDKRLGRRTIQKLYKVAALTREISTYRTAGVVSGRRGPG